MDIYNLMLGDYVRTNDNWNEQVSNKICAKSGCPVIGQRLVNSGQLNFTK